ncbi:MAG: 2-phospho-L-lactate guanylyltransferase [Acidimicrobiales bacterium]
MKSFGQAKLRLATVLAPEARAKLAREMAEHVLDAARPLPCAVVCDDNEVSQWAARRGAIVLHAPAQGLNRAVSSGVETLFSYGATEVIVVHSDLPYATNLIRLSGYNGITLVPDRYESGTNVVCIPAGCTFRFSYGQGSFRRHLDEALHTGLQVRIIQDTELGLDVDMPEDLYMAFGDTRTVPENAANRTPATSTTHRAFSAAHPPSLPVLELPSPTQMLPSSCFSADMPIPVSALAIGAHPDDIELGCGGTLAKWADSGTTIHYLILTDGSKGTWDRSSSPATLALLRREEQYESARKLTDASPENIVWLEAVDGELDCNRINQREVSKIIRLLRPQVVLGHDPWRRYRIHPDHRNAGFLTIDAIVAARDHSFFTELELDPHRPEALLLFEPDQPNHVEDIGGYLETKLTALMAHRSQLKSTFGIDTQTTETPDRYDMVTTDAAITTPASSQLAARLEHSARMHGNLVTGITHGEAFHLLANL